MSPVMEEKISETWITTRMSKDFSQLNPEDACLGKLRGLFPLYNCMLQLRNDLLQWHLHILIELALMHTSFQMFGVVIIVHAFALFSSGMTQYNKAVQNNRVEVHIGDQSL